MHAKPGVCRCYDPWKKFFGAHAPFFVNLNEMTCLRLIFVYAGGRNTRFFMNRFFLLLPALFLVLSTQLFAADEEIRNTKENTGVVAKALAKVRYLKGNPNPGAKYYIYLHSASWCGPCCKEMPEIVKSYKELEKQGFEIILFGHDHSDDGVVEFAKRFEAQFPMLKDSPELASMVPGYKEVRAIPHIIVVDQSGKEIVDTHPALFFPGDQWKNYIPKEETGACQDSSAPPAKTE